MARINLITRSFTTTTLNGYKLSEDMKSIIPVSMEVEGTVTLEEALDVARKSDKAVAGIASAETVTTLYGMTVEKYMKLAHEINNGETRQGLVTRTCTTTTLNGYKLSEDMKSIIPVSMEVEGTVTLEEALDVARKSDKAVAGIASAEVKTAIYGLHPITFRENAEVLPPRNGEEAEEK